MSKAKPQGTYLDASDVADSGHERSITVSDVAHVLVYRWVAVVICAVIGLVAAGGYLLVVKPTYIGTADVAVRAIVQNPFSYPSSGAERSVNMNVESAMAEGSQVTSAISRQLNVDVKEATSALKVETPVGGQILRFQYSASSRQQAVDGANTAAKTYLAVRQQMYSTQLTGILKSFDSQLASLTSDYAAAAKKAASEPQGKNGGSTPASEAAVERMRGLESQMSQLQQSRAEFAATDITPGFVTNAASSELTTGRDSGLLLLIAGLLGGALVGAVAAYIGESTDRRIRSAVDAREITGLSMVGSIRRRGLRRDSRSRVDVKYVAHAIAQNVAAEGNPRVVLIASRPNEIGRLLADIGVALAGVGLDVYLGTSSNRMGAVRARVKAGGAAAISSGKDSTEKESDREAAARATGTAIASREAAGARDVEGSHTDGTDTQLTMTRLPLWTGMDDTAVIPALRDATVSDGTSDRPAGVGKTHGSVATMRQAMPRAGLLPTAHGSVRVGLVETAPTTGLVLIEAPSAETDDIGVREARSGTAILVVARDLSRVREVRRLTERVRAAGVTPVGFVLTRSSHA